MSSSNPGPASGPIPKPIPRAVHGVVDYAYAAILAAAPFALGFAALPAWGFAAVVLVVTLLTRFEVGVWRVLPYRLHLAGDVLGGLFMIAAPFLFGFADAAAPRNAFLVFGVFALVAATLSQTDEMGQVRARRIGRGPEAIRRILDSASR